MSERARGLKEKFGKLWAEIRKGNWDYFFDALAFRLPVRFFSYFHFYLYLCEKFDFSAIKRSDVWCRFGDVGDIDMLVDMGLKREIVESRLRYQYRVAIAGRDNKALAAVWATIGNDRYPGSDAYFVYGGYTKPSERGQGFSSLCQDLINRTFHKEGRLKSYGTIGALNTNSIRIHEKMGFDRVGDGIYMIILGIVMIYFRSWPFNEGKIRFFLKKPPDNEKLWYLP